MNACKYGGKNKGSLLINWLKQSLIKQTKGGKGQTCAWKQLNQTAIDNDSRPKTYL